VLALVLSLWLIVIWPRVIFLTRKKVIILTLKTFFSLSFLRFNFLIKNIESEQYFRNILQLIRLIQTEVNRKAWNAVSSGRLTTVVLLTIVARFAKKLDKLALYKPAHLNPPSSRKSGVVSNPR
jgi:hypothetical protein